MPKFRLFFRAALHLLSILFPIALLMPAPVWAQIQVAPAPATVTGRNKAVGKPNILNGIRETRLPNGLTVLTKEVHAAPVVYFAVYYKVGSVNEEVGQTGMSHLMEHMMFKGTRTRGPGVISRTLQDNGADFNASTSYDRTEYHETLAADRLEMAMQIESDRMVNSVYDEAQHQKEMTVVRSEYEAGENDPANVLDKAVRLTAYQVHPYRWETIGFLADIENFTRDEMYAYYKNYYAPNNATVVIVGDFETEKALALVRRYFGPISPHSVAQHFITPEPVQEGERRVTVRRAGTIPLIEIAYHIPAFGTSERYAADILETALSNGRTGRLFQDLVQTGLVSDASASDYGLRDPDLLTIQAGVQPGHTPAEVEAALLAEVDKLKAAPVSAEEMSRALRQAEAAYLMGKESVEQQGDDLGENAMRGDWRFGETYLEDLRRVTPAAVQQFAQKYLTEQNRTIGRFDPLSQDAAASPAAAPPAAPVVPVSASSLPAAATPGVITPDADSPVSVRRAQSTVQKPEKVVLDNGLTVVVQENHATPTVSLEGALLSAGGVFDPPGMRGLSELTASQLSRGTKSRSLLEIARILEGVGATVGIEGGEEDVALSGHALTGDFNTMLDVLSDELRHPSFPADELEKSRAQALAGIEDQRQETGVLSEIALSRLLFPVGHPYYSPSLDETAAALKAVKREDLVGFYDSHYAPDRMVLTIVGDVKTGDAIAAVRKYFGDWRKKGGLPPVVVPDTPLPAPPIRPLAIFVPDKAQVDVRYGYPGQVKRIDPDYYASVVLDTILGGGSGLSSRLALSVRDRLGLVYGIYASDSASLGAGVFKIEFGSNPANVDRAVAEMKRQLRLLRDTGVTKQEVKQAVSYLTGSYPVTLSTNGAVAGQLLTAQIYGLGLDYIQKRNSYYRSVTAAQVNAAIKKYIQPDRGALVIVGTYFGQYRSHAK